MNKPDLKTNLLSHSEAKVRLLGEYITRYLNIISNDNFTEEIHVYDLFCGQGIYENGGEGSPIVALKKIKQIYFSTIAQRDSKTPKINCYFNDIDNEKIEKLNFVINQSALHYSSIGRLELTSNDYKVEVSKLKEKIKLFKNEKAFVFIDPYGYKELVAKDIKDLLCKKTEILIWLPLQFMYRFSDEGTPPVLKNLMLDLNINEKSKLTKNVWEYIHLLKNGLQKFLGSNYFVDHFSLKKEENTVFCLFFFTSHIKGFEKMLESKWQIDTEEGRGWEYSGNSPTLFFEQKTNEFEIQLVNFIKGNKRFNCDIYEFTLREGYLIKHTNEILSNLQKKGILQVFLSDSSPARKNSFYIRYHRSNDINIKKVYFVIN